MIAAKPATTPDKPLNEIKRDDRSIIERMCDKSS